MDSQTKLTDQPSDAAAVLTNLEELIKNHISKIDQLKKDSKNARSMLDDHLKNDPVYKEHSEKAKEASKVKNATKKQILSKPQLFELNQKVKEIGGELKELQNGLSDYLHEFQRLSGQSEIKDSDGQVREIVLVAKLVTKPQKNS